VPTGAAAATARFAAVDVPLTDDDPATSVLAGDRRRRLLGAVRTLPEPQWRVVACWYFLDLDEAAITTALGLPAGTVKSRLHRALRRLRKYLTSDGTEALERLGILGDAGTETTESKPPIPTFRSATATPRWPAGGGRCPVGSPALRSARSGVQPSSGCQDGVTPHRASS
jgi:hypothetical protein